jgi:hypothetical protein
MTRTIRKRLIRSVSLALAAMALSAPLAQARTDVFVPGVTDFPSAKTDYTPGVTDFRADRFGVHVVAPAQTAAEPQPADTSRLDRSAVAFGIAAAIVAAAIAAVLVVVKGRRRSAAAVA